MTFIWILTFVTALGCGLAGGVFFAFDSFVMPALRRLTPEQGIAAMQEMNLTAVLPALMIELMGTGLLCVVLLVISLVNLPHAWAIYVLLGTVVYLLGAIGTTMSFHVPRNNRLAALEPTATASAEYWQAYLREWTAGNVIRTWSGAAAAVLLIVGVFVA
jgi:uncharacterized membrane protein